MRRLLLITTFIFGKLTYAQDNSNIGFGGSTGYKCPTGGSGFIIEYKFKKRFDLYIGSSFSKFNGFGYAFGVDYFLTNRNFQPFIGIAYNNQNGDNFYVGNDSSDRTDFSVKPSSHIIGMIGFRKLLISDVKTDKNYISIAPYFTYRYSFTTNKVIQTGGVINTSRESRINMRLDNGFGFGIKAIFFFKMKKDK